MNEWTADVATDKKALKRSTGRPPRPCKAQAIGVPLTSTWGVHCQGFDSIGKGPYDPQREAENSQRMLEHLAASRWSGPPASDGRNG